MNISTIWLTTNRSCNNNCDWCYARESQKNKHMNIQDAFHIVDVAKTMGVKKVILIGGEPTLYENIFELTQYIHSKGMKVWIASNGRAFSNFEFSKKIVDSGADRFDLSLKATTEEEYLKATHSKGFEELIKGYSNLAKLGLFPSVSYVIVNDSFEKIEEIVKIIENNNIRNFTFQFVKPVIQMQSEEIMDIDSMGKFAKKIYERMQTVDTNFRIELSFPLCAIERNTLINMIKEQKVNTCCHIQRGAGVVFDTDFKILPCNHFVELPFTQEKMNKCTQIELEKYLRSDKVNNFRNVARKYPAEKCISCKLWDYCGGGCFTRWFYLNPNDQIKGFEDDGISIVEEGELF